jgi:acetyl-CoA carboxylase biotin carboxyl carrier protein
VTAGVPAVNGQQVTQDPAGDAGAARAELEHVRDQAVELLARLSRPPRSLRIAAGAVSLEITWDELGEVTSAGRAGTWQAGHGTARPAADEHRGPPGDCAVQEYLRSPGVGVFYHASEPGAEPFISVGTVVSLGQQIGIIEAMKLMIPVEADRAGEVTGILKANGEPVEYGEPLFALSGQEPGPHV